MIEEGTYLKVLKNDKKKILEMIGGQSIKYEE